MPDEPHDSSLLISLLTTDKRYAIPDVGYSVPSSSTRDTLTHIVNGILRENGTISDGQQQIKLDFLVGPELLRSALSEHITEHGISCEKQIQIFYFEATLPPNAQHFLRHDDWVSAIDVRSKWLLTGCYDGTVHIWSPDGKRHFTTTAQALNDCGQVKGISWINLGSLTASFVSVSHSEIGLLWRWTVGKGQPVLAGQLQGHDNALECVHVSDTGDGIVTGGWDCTIRVWPTLPDDGEPKKKKSKISSQVENIPILTPKLTLNGHRERISAVQYVDDDVLSASWDQTIRLWDLEYGSVKNEIVGHRAFLDGQYSKLNNLIIASNSDCCVKMFDPRADNKLTNKVYLSHGKWVKSVRWSVENSNLFVSGSFDSLVKMWDIRSSQTPLYDLIGHNGKVFCVNWSEKEMVASGGQDCMLRIYKTDTKVVSDQIAVE